MKKILLAAMFLTSAAATMAQQVTDMVIHMKDKTVKTISIADIDSLTFETVETTPGELTLSCTIDELTPTHATYTINASNSTDTYYQFIMAEETYNNMISQYGTIQDHDQAWWTELSTYYENTTWEDVMRMQMKKGTQTFQSNEIINSLVPQTSYIIYYYGIDDNGTMTTQLGTTRFTTPAPGQSDNSFTITDIQTYLGGVYFTVTPTNNDTYYATAQRKSVIDQQLASGKTMKEIVQTFINIEANYGDINGMLHNGEERINLSCGLEDTDYVICVCGYDGGISTDVTTAQFHSAK